MEIGRRRKAAAVYQEEKQVLAAKCDRAANLQAILEAYSACGGYINLDFRRRGLVVNADEYSKKLCEPGLSGGDRGDMRGVAYRANRCGTRSLLHAIPH